MPALISASMVPLPTRLPEELPASSPESVPSQAALSAQWVTQGAALLALERDWNALLKRSAVDCIFLTFDWVWTWWQHFGDQHALRVLVLRRTGEIVGIVPLMISKQEGFRVLQFVASKLTDYKDFILSPKEEREAGISAVMAEIERLPGWDIFYINGFRVDSPHFEPLQHALAARPNRSLVEQRWVAPYVPVQTQWEGYWKTLSSKFRSTIRYNLNRMHAHPDYSFQPNTPVEGIDEHIEQLGRFHIARWRDVRGQYSLFEDPTVARFYKSLAHRVADRGWVRLPSIRVLGTLVALQLGFEYAGRFYGAMASYDPEFSATSPGVLMMVELLRDAFDRKLAEVDFMTGDEAYKFKFQPKLRVTCAVRLFRAGLRGWIARSWFLALRPRLERLQNSRLSALYSWYHGRMLRRG